MPELSDPILGQEAPTCCFGLKRDCRKWIDWRQETGNRNVWRAICSVILIGEFIPYFYLTRSHPVLWFMGITFAIKALIETWGQYTATWICPGTYFVFFMIYVMIIPSVAYMFGYCTMAADIDFPYRDAVAIFLYLFGSMYSLSYELHRFWWKARSENKGKLHTIGLAAFCIHPNYFGDLFTYTGWGLAAGTICSLSVPSLMVWSFVFIVNPNSDKYLAMRYPEEFPKYAETTATLIPFLRSKVGLMSLGWICFALSFYISGTKCYGPHAPCGA